VTAERSRDDPAPATYGDEYVLRLAEAGTEAPPGRRPVEM